MTNIHLSNGLLIGQFKGGVGKTSINTNVAGLLAASGQRVLLVDLDRQGNTHQDLSLPRYESTANVEAYRTRDASMLDIQKDVRPSLDLVSPGTAIRELYYELTTPAEWSSALSATIGAIAHEYDLILFDVPPSIDHLTEGVLELVRGVVTPYTYGALESVKDMAEAFQTASFSNPHLRFLGVVAFRVVPTDTKIIRDFEREAAAVFDTDYEAMLAARSEGAAVNPRVEPTFRALIREARGAAAIARSNSDDQPGMLIQEIVDTESGRGGLWRDHLVVSSSKPLGKSTNAGALLADYIAFIQEMFARLAFYQAEDEGGK